MHVERRSGENSRVFPLKDGDELVLSLSRDKFLLLRSPGLSELNEIVSAWLPGHLEAVKQVFRSLPADLEDCAFRRESTFLREHHPIGLAGTEDIQNGARGIKPAYFKNKNITAAIESLGIARKNKINGERRIGKVLTLSTEDAQKTLNLVMGATPTQFVAACCSVEQALWIDPDILSDLAQAKDSAAFLEAIASACCDIFSEKTTAKQKNRRFARYFLGKHLHNLGIWLFPTSCFGSLINAVPYLLSGMARARLPSAALFNFDTFFRSWVERNADSKTLHAVYWKSLRFIDHTSTFGHKVAAPAEFFDHYKLLEELTSRDPLLQGIRYVWRALHEFHGTPLPADARSLKLAGKIKVRDLQAFAWVDNPSVASTRYEEVVGKPTPTRLPVVIVDWAERLRGLLPLFQVKEIVTQINALSEWLVYLCTLVDPPSDFDNIERGRHINAAGDPNEHTFMDYLKRREIAIDNKNRAISILRQAWTLDRTKQGKELVGCPIDVAVDRFKARVARTGKTSRRAIDQEILEIIIEANRANDFEFSRTRASGTKQILTDYYRVNDPETGEVSLQWWPGMGVIIDLLLNVPIRKISARYLDSGEGDEEILDIKTLEYRPNPLPTATTKRQQAFLVRKQNGLLRDSYVLGMFINTNKTGAAYEVAWIDQAVAKNVQRVIDWQKRFNPISHPVPCRDNASTDQYVDLKSLVHSYPIFRQPDNLGYPPADSAVGEYFKALLKHCEPIIRDRLGLDISLFRKDGTAIFDIHSLRVTGVTTLLENGVDPEIVKELVGHASVEMTFYYNAIRDSRIREAIQRALEQRRASVKHVSQMSQKDFDRFSAYVFNTRDEEDQEGLDLLRDKVLNRDPHWEVLPHGICPGGNCSEGGEWYKNKHRALPRSRACSLCRFRITGPAFIGGLVTHANELMWEIKQSLRTIAELRDKADHAEDAGQDPERFHGQIRHEKQRQDDIWKEWLAEIVYVRKAELMLDEWLEADDGNDKNLPALLMTPLEKGKLSTMLDESHDLRFLQNLIKDSDIIAGITLPRGVVEDRDELMMRIMRSSDADHPLLYRLDRKRASAALSLFADAILEAVTDDRLEALAAGTLTFADFPALETRINDLVQKAITSSQPSGESRGLRRSLPALMEPSDE